MRFSTPKTLAIVTAAALAAATAPWAVMAQNAAAPADAAKAMFDFAAMDGDKDGTITKAEAEAFRAAEIAALDTDKDGKISAAELAAHHVARASAQLQARADNFAKHLIVDLDSDSDGALTLAEMTAGDGRSIKMFDRVDADSDGAISQAEADAAQAKMAERGGRHSGKGGFGGGHGGGRDGGKGGFGGFW